MESELFQEVFRKQRDLVNPVDLSVGLPEGPTPEHIKLAGIEAINSNHTIYTPANGIPELREAVARKLTNENNLPATASNVTIVPGLTTGMLVLYLAILNPGDEVMMMDPCYPSYHYLAPLADGRIKRIPVRPNFQLDLDEIERSLSPKTKLIIINTPNNPTGAVYPKEDLIRLAEIAKRYDTLIVADEIYEDFVYDGEHFSIGSIYPNTITMNGFSKTYSMTGWRLGYIHGPQFVIDLINRVQQYAIFSSSSISQYAALEALARPARSRESYRVKRNLINTKMTELGYEVQGNNGAYYTFIHTPNNITDLDFVNLAAEHNLLLLPGRAFSQDQTYVRLSYGGKIEDVAKGLEIIKKITR